MEHVCGAGSHAEYADRPDPSGLLDSLIAQQDSLLSTPHIRRKVITHHNSYTIHHKKKGFFKRLADVFAPGKEDSTQVSNVIQEEYTDTLDEVYSPIDTISSMITGIQHKVFQNPTKGNREAKHPHQQPARHWKRTHERVNQLLENIEHDEQEAARTELMQEEEIRKEAAETMAKIPLPPLYWYWYSPLSLHATSPATTITDGNWKKRSRMPRTCW